MVDCFGLTEEMLNCAVIGCSVVEGSFLNEATNDALIESVVDLDMWHVYCFY